MTKIYGCYVSGNYIAYKASEAQAQRWAAAHGQEFQGAFLKGQYALLEVSPDTARALLREQPCLGHDEALAYV